MALATEHEPRRAENLGIARQDAPTSLHAHVIPEHEVALELEEQVLADGAHGFEPPAVEPRRQLLHGGARVRRLDLELVADEHLQAARCAVDGVAFRHRATTVAA